jgi:hypothetical protein
VNPGAVELVEVDFLGKPLAKQIDNDCDGKILQPNEPTACDKALGPVLNNLFDGARAMGLCKVQVDEDSKKWGVISAGISDISAPPLGGGIKATGKALEHAFGLLPNLGPKTLAREGERLFALSTGIARAPGQPGWTEVSDPKNYSKNYSSGQPNGFPKATAGCETAGTPNDGVAFDLKIRVPTNARSLRFKYRYFGHDYPQYTCSSLNDVFSVMMSPSPLKVGDPMADGQNLSANITFEKNPANGTKKTIGINNEIFLSACEPGASKGVYPNCKAGNGAQLEGSGFEGNGATSWLVNQTNVPPGEIIFLRFAIWDSGDGIFESTVVVDDFEWSTVAIDDGAVNFAEGTASSGGSGGTGGTGGAGGSGGSSFGGSGGSGGSGIFGGAGGASGGSSGAGGSGGSSAGSGSGGTGSGGSGGVPGPCPDGSCAAPGQCCLNPGPPAQCGQDFSGLLCLLAGRSACGGRVLQGLDTGQKIALGDDLQGGTGGDELVGGFLLGALLSVGFVVADHQVGGRF